MIKNEIAELRRRFKIDYNAISNIYGYYINSNKDVISTFDTSLGLMDQSETEIYLSVLKKTLSGSIGRNLIDIPFATAQVENSPEHRLLMRLKDSQLRDEEARNELVEKIIPTVSFDEDNYLILMAADAYDLSYRDSNLEDMADGGSEVFKYFICCVCPVKPSKLKLQYHTDDGEFHSTATGSIAASPEMGFMFPCFDDRTSNIYNALFYTKKPAFMYQEFMDEVFNIEKKPMSAPQQRVEFEDVIVETLAEECSFDVVKNLNTVMRDKVETHKIDKIPETLELTIGQVADVLSESGVDASKVEDFTTECENRFGKFALLQPENIVEVKKLNIEAPGVKISVDPDKSDIIRTKTINGGRYILIPASEGVEINGMRISAEDMQDIEVE